MARNETHAYQSLATRAGIIDHRVKLFDDYHAAARAYQVFNGLGLSATMHTLLPGRQWSVTINA